MPALDRSTFFETRGGFALTFDDVTIQTGRSDFGPSEVNISGRFSSNIELYRPFVSAAMDTVTTAPMAIAMAKLGGLGIIHAGLDIEQQYREVRRVKLCLNGLIEQPRSVTHGRTLGSVLKEKEDKAYPFSRFLVTGRDGRLAGVITQNDFEMNSASTRVSRAMTSIEDVVTAPETTTLKEAYKIMRKAKKKMLPLIDVNGMPAGLYIWSDVDRIVNENPEGYSLDSDNALLVGAAVPTDETAIDRVRRMSPYLDVVVLDSAQGDSKYAFSTLETLHHLKEEFPGLDIVVGNVTDGQSARDLVDAGANGVKVGQGGGSICTTRRETGIGTPQLTAVYECASATEGSGVPICSDGGIVYHGDVLKALSAGAESVMMGQVFAGTDESPGDVILHDGKSYKYYRGMGSESALRDSAASRKRYGGDEKRKPRPEGVESLRPYVGPVENVVGAAADLLAKGMSYTGIESVPELHTRSRWWQVTASGQKEAHPHDVMVVAPGAVRAA